MNGMVGPSPPIVTIAPIPAHQSDRSEGLSLLAWLRPGSLAILTSQLLFSTLSFQPYRSGFEESLRTNSSSSLVSMPLPSHLLPYEALTFPYHQFLPHPNPSHLSHHVPHPSASYRLGDNYYLDRFGLLRGQLPGPSAPMPLTGSGTTSSVPFNLVRYSELLNSQTERLINDERQRLLSQTLSQSAYKPNAQTIDSPPLHMPIVSNNERPLIDYNSEHQLVNHSMSNHLTSGSILSGTPRDVTTTSSVAGNSVRKQTNVLLETTKQQQRHTSNASKRETNQPMNAITPYVNIGSTSGHNWSGIEAVMEAYDRYSYDKTPKTTPPTTTAPLDEWQQMRQLSLTKKLKFMFVKYWYISIPVHMVTSVLWFGTTYLIAKSGFDVKPILDMIRPYAEKLPLPEFVVHILNSDTNASSAGYVAIALILYKLATPARYATTVGVSFYSIEFFVKRGLIKPVPSGQQIKAQVNQSISRSKLNKVLRERLAKKEELRRRAKKQNTTKK
ncbi:unnamed protein product [Oppiella nova]|uniref:DUF1279 domain-containing protein n=1 Tax=Oppiella nova TaxID=334625 RepID=A0A7R9MA12_9ACAR|nr:unnamed protein product [Oppiella nova]CAG2172251.1 unnamed protein product [Oppiella nova]